MFRHDSGKLKDKSEFIITKKGLAINNNQNTIDWFELSNIEFVDTMYKDRKSYMYFDYTGKYENLLPQNKDYISTNKHRFVFYLNI